MTSIQQVDDFYCAQQQGDCESLKTCVNASTTMDAIKAQALEGVNAQVRGTPAIFANGKLLSWGHILPVLEKAYKHGP
jgi:protein-disulfide isomerase